MWPIKLVTLVLIVVKGTNCNRTDDVLAEDAVVYRKYNELDKNLKRMVNTAVKYMLPYAMEARNHLNISSGCTSDLLRLTMDLRKLKLSALRFLDAAAKLPEGFILGRNFLLGDFEECLKARVLQRNGDVAFRGRYCVVKIQPLSPKLKKYVTVYQPDKQLLEATKNVSELMKYILKYVPLFNFINLQYGICVPTGCSTNDINEILHYLSDQLNEQLSMKVDYCDYDGKYPVFRTRMIVAICILSLLCLLVFTGTMVENYDKKRNISPKSLCVRILTCFSLVTNFPKLISTKTSEDILSCICGVRSISLLYMILMYDFIVHSVGNKTVHYIKAFDDLPTLPYQIVVNGLLTVDVFFFVGGLVNCYVRMKMNEERPLRFLLHRLIRIYPALLFVIFIVPNIFDQAYGPERTVAKEYFKNCDSNWWRNLLFINNFYDQRYEVCMSHTWYIAADMQLFVISLFTIPVLMKSPKKGILLHLVIMFIGVIVASTWVWYKGVQPTIIVLRPLEELRNRYYNAVATTAPHIATYFFGVLVGYFLHVKKSSKIPKIFRITGWPIAALLSIWMLFMPVYWNSGNEYTILGGIFYFSFSRLVYVTGVAWMVICCVKGYGGIVNRVLSMKIWIPIAKISFMTYMISMPLVIFQTANSRLASDQHLMVTVWQLFGDVMSSFLVGLILVVLVESPFIALEKLLLRGTSGQKTGDPVNGSDNPVFMNNFENNIVLEKGYIADNSKL